DYPRIQFVVALAVLLALYIIFRRSLATKGWALLALATVAIGYNVYRVHPYATVLDEQAIAVAECPADSRVRVLVANVQKGNRQAQALIDLVRNVDPDLFLAMETDEWWDAQLRVLADELPHRIQHIPQEREHYGIHLFSRLELIEPEIEFVFGQDTPAVFSTVRLRDGATVAFQGLHPEPPLFWSQPTTMRDARLVSAALRAREAGDPVIMAGDFNAVPWERITRRSMRIGELLDPRVGRGLYPTYDAKSLLISWPLDQILYQKEFALASFQRLEPFGSDHYPVLAELCHMPAAAERQSPPPLADGDLEEAQASLEAARAAATDEN
ncbi:MAG TPA: endonuclease/exonuclease/phosphatase family protein, partial [Saliniramus sp.]|nr:endonuclease/exonuclease/phosphatase family protein [Saliniramus sp.]